LVFAIFSGLNEGYVGGSVLLQRKILMRPKKIGKWYGLESRREISQENPCQDLAIDDWLELLTLQSCLFGFEATTALHRNSMNRLKPWSSSRIDYVAMWFSSLRIDNLLV
jgi:hypothetical protein